MGEDGKRKKLRRKRNNRNRYQKNYSRREKKIKIAVAELMKER